VNNNNLITFSLGCVRLFGVRILQVQSHLEEESNNDAASWSLRRGALLRRHFGGRPFGGRPFGGRGRPFGGSPTGCSVFCGVSLSIGKERAARFRAVVSCSMGKSEYKCHWSHQHTRNSALEVWRSRSTLLRCTESCNTHCTILPVAPVNSSLSTVKLTTSLCRSISKREIHNKNTSVTSPYIFKRSPKSIVGHGVALSGTSQELARAPVKLQGICIFCGEQLNEPNLVAR
jgi:hypothetical protein